MEDRVLAQRSQKSQGTCRVEFHANPKKAIDSFDFNRAEELERKLDAKQMGEVSATFDDIKPELVSELQTAI
jgi:hypothetical protein